MDTGVAASVSAGRIGAVELPLGVCHLLLMQDRDAAGERAWEALRARWGGEDSSVDLARAVPRAKDANDELLEHGPEALRGRLRPWLAQPSFMMRLPGDHEQAGWRRSQALRDQRLNEVREELRRLVGDVIGLRYVETLPHGAWGQYADGLITLAVGEGTGDPAATLNHEIIHALRECGLIDDEEWGELERVARAEWLDHPALDIRGRWPGRDEEELVGEAICEAYRSWCEDMPVPTGIQAVFGRIRRFIGNIRRWAGLGGIRSWEDIFESIRGGDRHITPEDLRAARAAMSRDIQDNMPRNDEGMEPSADGRARGTNVTDKWRQRPWLADKPPVTVVDGGLPEGFPDDPHTQAVWRKWQSDRLDWALGAFFRTVRRKSGQPLVQGNIVRNADGGMNIRITKDGIQHTLRGSEGTSPDGREAIVANLPELLGAAVLYQTVPAGKARSVDCYHSFLVPMADGEDLYAVRLVVRQAGGNFTFYTAGILAQISNTPTLPPQGTRTISGRTVPLAQLVEGVHYYDETKDMAVGPMILGSSWSGLGARLRRRRVRKPCGRSPKRRGGGPGPYEPGTTSANGCLPTGTGIAWRRRRPGAIRTGSPERIPSSARWRSSCCGAVCPRRSVGRWRTLWPRSAGCTKHRPRSVISRAYRRRRGGGGNASWRRRPPTAAVRGNIPNTRNGSGMPKRSGRWAAAFSPTNARAS